jgi:quinolinate synthase
MAETAKVLSPDKRVLISDKKAGCSLADNFDPAEIDRLKELHPGAPAMIYINSYAAAKARCEVTCTSANAVEIARKMPGDKIIFVPDILFAENLEQDLRGEKTVIFPGKDSGTRGSVCEVHEKFTLDDLLNIRKSFEMPKGHPNRLIYAHWECRPDVLREADFYGSTSQISKDIAARVAAGSLESAFVASECELTSNLSQEFPGVRFATACSVRCQWMARMTLEGILDILRRIDSGGSLERYEVNLEPEIIRQARTPIEKMLELSS